MEECFPFFSESETVGDITTELFGMLDSAVWKSFTSEPVTKKKTKKFFDKFENSEESAEHIFISYTPSDICNKFIENQSLNFFLASLNFASQGDCFALSFIETLLRRAPKVLEKLDIKKKLSPQTEKILLQASFAIFFEFGGNQINKFINTFSKDKIISFLLEGINEFDVKKHQKVIDFLCEINENTSFIDILKEKVNIAFENREKEKITFYLDLIEVYSERSAEEYETLFKEIFVPFSNPDFVELLVERSSNIEKKRFGKMQSELLPASIAAPLRAKFLSEILELASDDEINGVADTFAMTRIVPKLIYEIFNKNRAYFDGKFTEIVVEKAKTNSSVKKLLDKLIEEKMIPAMNDGTKIIDNMNNGTDRCDIEVIEYFKKYVDPEDYVESVFNFETDVLQKIIPKQRAILAGTVMKLLEVDSTNELLAMLALRLPINRLIHSFVSDDAVEDYQRLNTIHAAGLHSASQIVLRGKPIPHKGICIDSYLILRLRWRTMRGDIEADNLSTNQVYQNLVADDIYLFMKWEMTSKSIPMSPKSLSGLNVITGQRCFDAVNGMIKQTNEDYSLFRVFLSTVQIGTMPSNLLVLPEKPNIVFLSASPFAWESKVLFHPYVCQRLKNPTPEVSLNLLYLMNRDRSTMLLATFPHAFAAIMINYNPMLNIPVPDLIKTARSILDGDLTLVKPVRKNLAYAVVSVLSRQGINLFGFMQRRQEQEWGEACLIFSVCNNCFDDAISIVFSRAEQSIDVLRKKIAYEELFFARGTWIMQRKKFAIYCAQKGIVINGSWVDFLLLVRSEGLEDPSDESLLTTYIAHIKSSQSPTLSSMQLLRQPRYA